MDYINLSDLAGKIPKLDMPNLPPINPPSLGYKIPHMETIDPEDTIMGDIKHKIQEQNDLAAKQIEVLVHTAAASGRWCGGPAAAVRSE